MFKTATANNVTATHGNASFFQKDKVNNAFIQPKLDIGKPGDKYEVEADRVADTIVAKGNEQVIPFFSQSPAIQKQTEEDVQKRENNEPEIQQKPLVESITPLTQRQPEEEQIQEKEGGQDIQKQEAEQQVQEKSESSPVTPGIQKQGEEIQQQPEEVQKKLETDQKIQEKPIVEPSKTLIQRLPEVEPVQEKEEQEEIQKQPEKEVQEQPIEEVQKQEPEKQVQKEPEYTRVTLDIQKEGEEVQEKEEEEEEPIQEKSFLQKSKEPDTNEEETSVQAKSNDTVTSDLPGQQIGGVEKPSIESQLSSSKGGGSPMSKDTRSKMESGFGTDFSNVRIHTDSNAAQMNQALGAQAFTHSNDIYFNEGKYDTSSDSGQHLLAHELTHTVQQGASIKRKPDIQLEEEVDMEELKRQIEESNKEQIDAFDPSEAKQTQEEATEEGKKGELSANDDVPEVVPPTSGPLPVNGESNGSRVAIPIPQKPDTVVPSSQKKEKQEPKTESISPEPSANADAAGSGSEGVAVTETGGTEGGETLKYLEEESKGVCNDGAKKSQELADNESAHDTSEEKAMQTDVAVEPPQEEGQSRSNAEQVSTLDGAEAPEANDEEIKLEMDKAISDAVPAKIKELNEFESEKKAQVIGNKVLAGTSKQVGEIKGTYNEIENTPPPAESPIPEPLPQIEESPDTANLDLGKGAVPVVPVEQTDLSKYEEEADSIYEKEGVSKDMQGELEKVDTGDIAEANKEKGVLKEKVANEPANLQSFAASEQNKVESNLQKEEEKVKTSMESKRKDELNGTKNKQEETKSLLELKREAVVKRINDRYKLAEDTVKEKLSNLESTALKKFDSGQKIHSQQFEKNVKKRVNAWKSDRYSGFWGGAKWIKDKFVGIDHFPEIKQIFTTERETFVKAIDLLIININQENEKTIQSCKGEITKAKSDIEEIIKKLGPELKEAGKKAQNENTKKLEALDKHIDQEKKKLQQKLCDKKDEAIKAIDKKIEEMKSEMSGLVGKLGALLLQVAKKFFKWAIEKIGGNADKIISIIDKGATVLKKLFTDPIGFFKNLVRAVGGGIKGFVANIVSWLKKGLVGWLMGQMGDSGLELPQKFDLKGIIFLGLQVAGLTWNVIRPRIVKGLGPKGETIMAAAEKGVDIIKRVVKEGPIALWDIIMEKAAEIKAKVMEGIRNWAITQIIKKMSVKLLSMLNPAGAIVQAIILLYDVVMFFVDNWDRIVDFVKSVFDSIGAIASGAIGQAAGFIEKTLGKTIPMILSFAARFVGLSGIGKAIRKVIETIQRPFKKILDKMIKFLVKQVKKLLKKLKGEKAKKGEVSGDDKDKHKKLAKNAIKTIKKLKTSNTTETIAKQKESAAAEENKIKKKIEKNINVEVTIDDKDTTITGKAEISVKIFPNTTDESESETLNKAADRIEQAQSIDKFHSEFNSEVWRAQFHSDAKSSGAGLRISQMDLKWGVDNDKITSPKRGKYVLAAMSEDEIISISVKQVLIHGRKHPALSGPEIVWENIRAFNTAIDRLPNIEDLYTQDICIKILEQLETKKELKPINGKPEKYEFDEIPSQRKLPDSWKSSAADKIRFTYYFNGSSYGSNRDSIAEKNLKFIRGTIALIESTDTGEVAEGKERWAMLKEQIIVIDDNYDSSKKSQYLRREEYEVDHDTPIAKHWNLGGNNSIWPTRQNHAEANLTFMHHSENEKKSGEGYKFVDKWWVGPDFTGPGTSKGMEWADESTKFKDM